MALDLNGKQTEDTLARIGQEEGNAIEGTVAADGEDVRASVEVSHSTSRWNLAAFADWARSKGWTGGAKGKWRF